jgi:hypothetical protein
MQSTPLLLKILMWSGFSAISAISHPVPKREPKQPSNDIAGIEENPYLSGGICKLKINYKKYIFSLHFMGTKI